MDELGPGNAKLAGIVFVMEATGDKKAASDEESCRRMFGKDDDDELAGSDGSPP